MFEMPFVILSKILVLFVGEVEVVEPPKMFEMPFVILSKILVLFVGEVEVVEPPKMFEMPFVILSKKLFLVVGKVEVINDPTLISGIFSCVNFCPKPKSVPNIFPIKPPVKSVIIEVLSSPRFKIEVEVLSLLLRTRSIAL